MNAQSTRRRGAVLIAGGLGALALGATAATTQAAATTEPLAGACATSGEPVTLEYWSWGAGYADAAAAWNALHPDIQVNYSDIPVGNAGGYQKVFTAVAAGTAPDIAFLEFDAVPSFVSQGAVLDVGPLLGDEATADFLPSFTDQVALTGPGSMYMVPLGGGPMALYYRADLFEANDIAVPTTWDELRTAGEQVRAADPDAHIVNFDGGGNANWFAGMAAQNGAQWFGYGDDNSWTVTLDGDESRVVADYWDQLLADDVASNLATFSPEWGAALAADQIWTWPSAVWGAGVLKSAAPDTAGGWAVAQLPAWEAGATTSASWGGGGLSVVTGTDHPCEAAQFALWMGSSQEALAILNPAIGIYPTTNTLLADPLFGEGDEFFGGQNIFEETTVPDTSAPETTSTTTEPTEQTTTTEPMANCGTNEEWNGQSCVCSEGYGRPGIGAPCIHVGALCDDDEVWNA